MLKRRTTITNVAFNVNRLKTKLNKYFTSSIRNMSRLSDFLTVQETTNEITTEIF